MSSGLASRLKHPRKHELVKSHSQAQLLANKLRQDGVMVAVEGVLQAVDQVAALLASNLQDFNYKDSIINLCQHLKVYGAYLEILYKEQLDHAFKIFRDKAQDNIRVDMLSRLHLLELIELRAKGWKGTDVSPGAKERLVQITGASEESINHAKQLIEETIRRNASPVREGSAGAAGPLTGSSSSINSSASDDSALPSSMRASRALMHSLSTPDANVGEYKYTVIANGHTIKITGDNLDLVRTSKLVLDEYFSGEPIHDMAQFYSFDSLPQPIVPDDLDDPLLPRKSTSPVVNGQPIPVAVKEEPDHELKLRKPRLSSEDSLKKSPDKDLLLNAKTNLAKSRFVYSIEVLTQLAMSPLCLSEPMGWDSIAQEYPTLVRKVVQCFDAQEYLSIRSEEPTGVLNAEDDIED
ncbi:eukaryotic translation initiation factor 4E-binding protein Mextli isoform X4 [Dendroctonus ponderosae]|uniref:Uncharacterized protein n=1 Tax=Dendroctonus ponderosae TaxID=77166 RepID=A0AAR5PQX3_DENPD|nr:eukaryotic translation initiation factor 4E-binding protein Mextli isoform X4 [Dendroctonus ponderosae]